MEGGLPDLSALSARVCEVGVSERGRAFLTTADVDWRRHVAAALLSTFVYALSVDKFTKDVALTSSTRETLVDHSAVRRMQDQYRLKVSGLRKWLTTVGYVLQNAHVYDYVLGSVGTLFQSAVFDILPKREEQDAEARPVRFLVMTGTRDQKHVGISIKSTVPQTDYFYKGYLNEKAQGIHTISFTTPEESGEVVENITWSVGGRDLTPLDHLQTLVTAFASAGRPVDVICGHSLGGGTSTVLHKSLSWGGAGAPTLITFGATLVSDKVGYAYYTFVAAKETSRLKIVDPATWWWVGQSARYIHLTHPSFAKFNPLDLHMCRAYLLGLIDVFKKEIAMNMNSKVVLQLMEESLLAVKSDSCDEFFSEAV